MGAGWHADVRVEPGERPHSGCGRALNNLSEVPQREGGAQAEGRCKKRGWPGTLQKCLESPIVSTLTTRDRWQAEHELRTELYLHLG
jgi:hypothetical protein